jgi:hypothetical protein
MSTLSIDKQKQFIISKAKFVDQKTKQIIISIVEPINIKEVGDGVDINLDSPSISVETISNIYQIVSNCIKALDNPTR